MILINIYMYGKVDIETNTLQFIIQVHSVFRCIYTKCLYQE